MKLAWVLVLVALPCVLSSRDAEEEEPLVPEAPAETRSRFAMLDDVRLLANGLLQLGHSLREFVHKTKGQINDIFQKLNIFDKSFYQLSVVTSEIKEEEEELKKTTTFLKANNEEIRSLSLEINSKINSILQDRSKLQMKVGDLEEKLIGLSHNQLSSEQNEISALKDVIETQEKCITDLLKAVKEQHEQLDHQKNKIKSLEEKLSDDTFQDTVEEAADFKPKAPSLEYLSKNSTNTSLDTDDLPKDCHEIFLRGERTSGVYPIKPNQSEPFRVYCEMALDAGSTVIQRRQDGSVDFDQTWEKYENGFGDLEREFWLGLAKIRSITNQGDYVLHVELEDWKQGKRHIEYQFTLEGPASHYTIHLVQVSGDLPDAMTNHTGMAFSTKDRDNDNKPDSSCANSYSGGWWFNACGDTNLNGKYVHVRPKGRTERRKGIYWKPGRGNSYSLKSTKISVRPR